MNNNQEEKKKLKENIQKELAELIDQETINDFNILQNAAKNFLNDAQILSDIYQRGISFTTIKSKITELYKGMREDSQYAQRMLEYQHEFENHLNEFLGRKIYLAYVTESGHINYYDDANIGKLYQEGTANRGRANISKNKIFSANDLTDNLKKAVDESEKRRIKVYQEAIRRYEKNDSEKAMHYSPSEKTFYWWKTEKNVIKGTRELGGVTDKILNKGIIAEGYAGAVINEDVNVLNNKIELGLQTLWINHIAKDSVGAAIKGDIVLDNDGRIQFAIKEGSFSTARIGQYIRLANNILQMDFLEASVLERPEVFRRLTGNSKNLEEYLNSVEQESAEIGGELIKDIFSNKNTRIDIDIM